MASRTARKADFGKIKSTGLKPGHYKRWAEGRSKSHFRRAGERRRFARRRGRQEFEEGGVGQNGDERSSERGVVDFWRYEICVQRDLCEDEGKFTDLR